MSTVSGMQAGEPASGSISSAPSGVDWALSCWMGVEGGSACGE
jgi:hypothetical protein